MGYELIFRKEYKDYDRDLNYVSLYLDQCVTYAKKMNPNIDTVAYRKWMNQQLKKEGKFPLNNRKMKMVMKDKNNDRFLGETTVLDYFNEVTSKQLRIVPTFTTYYPETTMRSLESEFLDVGMETRGKEKKLKFKAKEEGNDFMADYHDKMQQAYKIQNNSSSGAKATPCTVMYNETGHSTLTSVCRSETSFANSVNEKFLGGFRHYFSADAVTNNILAVLTFVDLDKVEAVMQKYQLHYVTQEELIEYIRRSTELYWFSPKMFAEIEKLVYKLSPLECSAYLYNSDFYGLRKFNETFVRKMYDDLLGYRDLTVLPLEEAEQYLKEMDADLAALIAVYCADICNGKSIWKTIDDNPLYKPYVGTIVKHVIEIFMYYADMIKVFWVTDVMPMETAHVPYMMRGVVLGSDTDSSLFAVDKYWVEWYCGKVIHNSIADNVEATTVFLTSQHIGHVLGAMTGVINITPEKRSLISMKNEFGFSSFTTTSNGKHYFAKKQSQEGIMIDKDKVEAEIKGVGLKHTKVPAKITKDFHNELYNIMNQIEADTKISILDYTKKVADLEWEIYNSILHGDVIYMQKQQVKSKESYKNENSIYKKGYEFWEYVFAPKYGHTVQPPYDSVKVNVTTNTRTKFMMWAKAIDDKALSQRLIEWVEKENEGRPIMTFYIPKEVASSVGLPTELVNIMEPRKLVYTITSPYYLVGESLGIYMKNDDITRLYSDDFPERSIPHSFSFRDESDDNEVRDTSITDDD